ncbi:hypothetical protein KSS87_016344 [Heliosperma pusillum]|nr:hypothetical protein KSS87_016344 [Heliosperma pusillum]
MSNLFGFLVYSSLILAYIGLFAQGFFYFLCAN